MSSFRRNSFWQLLQSVSSTGIDLLVLLAFSAKLDAIEFGQLTVLLSFAKIVFLLCEPRIHEYLIPRLVRAASRSRHGVWVWTRIGMAVELCCNLLALLACTLVYLLAPSMLEAQAGDAGLFPFAVLFVLTSTLLKFSSIAVFRALGKVKTSAIAAMGVGAVKLIVLSVSMYALNWGTAATLSLLSAVGLGAALLQMGIALFALRTHCGVAPDVSARKLRGANICRSAKQIFSNYAMGLLEIAHRELDMQLLASLAGPVEAGRYRIGKNMAMILMELLNPVVMMLLPEFSMRVAQRKWQLVTEFARRAALILSGLAASVGLLMYFIVPLLMVRFLPAQVDSIPTFKLVLLGYVVSAPLMWSQSLLVALSKAHRYVVASAIGATTALVAAFLLVPSQGAAGSAIAFGCGLLAVSAIAAYMAVLDVRQVR